MISPKLALRLVGIASIILAILGLLYTIGLIWNLQSTPDQGGYLYQTRFLYAMSFICISFYICLMLFGFHFIRLQTKLYRIFVWLIVIEVLYYTFVAALWIFPNWDIASSAAAASGINGGLLIQFITFFPIWAPLIAIWAHRKIRD
jgi:hypothetical protein